MDWRLGTMGFSESDWADPFYPRGMKASEYLSYYAKWFDTVELDTTFYAIPDAERVRKWAAATPDGFQFAVKTPREITHEGPIDRRIGAMQRFLDVLKQLGGKLGPVLLQFGPGFTSRELPALARFLGELPEDVQFAAEFRHPSWDSDETESILREHRICWAATHYVIAPMAMRITADWLYIRWIGQHERFKQHRREEVNVTPHLEWWQKELERVPEQVKRAWGFFSNDYSGYAVATCERFKRMVGVTVKERTHNRDEPSLFG